VTVAVDAAGFGAVVTAGAVVSRFRYGRRRYFDGFR